MISIAKLIKTAGYRLACAGLTASMAMGSAAQSQQLVNSLDDVVSVSLLPGWRDDPLRHIAAIGMDLAPGWKTYWRSPGDGGLRSEFDWSGSQNLSKTQISWPHPRIFRDAGLRSIGYVDRLVLPVILTAKEPGDIPLRLHMQFGVCNEICIPAEVMIEYNLSPATVEQDPEIVQALSQKPRRASEFGMSGISCELSQQDGAHELSVWFQAPELPGRAEALVIEAPHPSIWTSEPRFERNGSDITATATMYLSPDHEADADLAQMRFTLISTTTSVEEIGCAPD